MLNMFKKFLIGAMIVLTTVGVSADALIKGKALPKSEVSISNVNQSMDLDNGNILGEKIFDYKVTNNDPDGFRITLSSTNQSELRHSTMYAADKDGSFIGYNISIVRGTGGRLGADEVSLPSSQSLNVPIDLVYNTNIRKGTKNAEYDVSINTSGLDTKDLLAGDFEDTITVVISNL